MVGGRLPGPFPDGNRNRGGTAGGKTPVLLSLLLLNFLAFAVSAADWPVFRGNVRRTGFSAEQAYPPLVKQWEFQTQGDVMSSPVVFEGMVYFGSRSQAVYALDAKTGNLVWQYFTEGWVDASPSVSGLAVYVPSRDGNLYALDRLTGARLWQAALGAPSVSSPLVFGGRVYAGTGAPQNRLKVFDAATGAFLWEYPAGQPVESAPSTDGVFVYFGSNDGRIYAVSAAAPSAAWPAPGYYQTLGSFGPGAIAVSSGSLYALPGHDERKLFVLNAADGSQKKASGALGQAAGENEVAAPLVGSGAVYLGAGSSPQSLYALDRDTLSSLWASTPSLGNTAAVGLLSSPSMADDAIYAGTVDGRLVSLSTAGTSISPDIFLGTSAYTSPAVSNGMVFVGTLGGRLMAYKAGKIASISCPGSDEVLNGTVAVKGYISNAVMSGYVLDYGRGDPPDAWSTLVSSAGARSAENGVLGYWNTQGLANGLYTLRLTVLETPPAVTGNTARTVIRVNYPPAPPSSLTAADVPGDNGNRIQLKWGASASPGVISYNIYRTTYNVYALLASVGSGATGYIDAAALTGTTFTYVLTAYDGFMESVNSNPASAFSINDNPASDAIPPAKTTDLAAFQGSRGGSARLAWTAPGNDGNMGAAAWYTIRYSSSANYDWSNFDGAVLWMSSRPVAGPAGTAETEEVRGLFGGVTYYFAIKTADFIPNFSPVSNAASAWATMDYTPPGAPANFAVADTPWDHGGSLTLTWSPSPDDGAGENDVYGYKIYRRTGTTVYASSAPYAVVPAGTLKYLDNAAPTGVRFYYVLSAFDSSNTSPLSPEAYGVSADNWKFLDASQGGSIRLEDGAQVDLPDNSASQNDNMIVRKVDPAEFSGTVPAAAVAGANPTPVVYEVKFENPATKLNKPATLSLPYRSSDVAGMVEENLRIYTSEGGRWTMLDTSRVQPDRKKVSAQTGHFSLFRIMEYLPSGVLLSAGSVYTYPNPARGDALTFKFYVADKARVTVDVYNVAGEKVARLEKDGCPAGVTSEIPWDIGGIASGVYIYRVEATSASGSRSVTKKLAVIH